MKYAALIVGVSLFLLASGASAQEGMPSDNSLTRMGLSSIQVLSDKEAIAIRGHGLGFGWDTSKFAPVSEFETAMGYRDCVNAHRAMADSFHADAQNELAGKSAWYGQAKASYQAMTQSNSVLP